jgi:hypothetical protein
VSSREGHFLHWDDFFSQCAPEASSPQPMQRKPEHRTDPVQQAEQLPLPFAEIAAIRKRLLRVAEALERVHNWAAAMQLGAEGAVLFYSGLFPLCHFRFMPGSIKKR